MDNESTIPSQLHPINTIPSSLGPMSGPSSRSTEPASAGISPVIKLLLVAAALVLAIVLLR